jgi:hypothetical protein
MNERLHDLTPKWVLLDVSLSPNVHIYAPPPSPFKWRIVYLNRPGQTHCDEVSMKYNTILKGKYNWLPRNTLYFVESGAKHYNPNPTKDYLWSIIVVNIILQVNKNIEWKNPAIGV